MSRICGSSTGSCIAARGRVGGAASSAVARRGDSVTGCRQHPQRTHVDEQFSCSDADSTGPHGSGRSISATPLTSKASAARIRARKIRFTVFGYTTTGHVHPTWLQHCAMKAGSSPRQPSATRPASSDFDLDAFLDGHGRSGSGERRRRERNINIVGAGRPDDPGRAEAHGVIPATNIPFDRVRMFEFSLECVSHRLRSRARTA